MNQTNIIENNKTPHIIAMVTALLVLTIAIISFALSYNALRLYALDNGIPEKLSYFWPLLVDVSLVVFSLTTVNAYLQNESAKKQWTLVGIYTIATIIFNALHANPTPQSIIVSIVAPLSLFFSFEILMSQFKNTVNRQSIMLNVQQLKIIHANLTIKNKEMAVTIAKKDNELHSIQTRIIELKTTKEELNRGFDVKSFELGQVDAMHHLKVPQKKISDMLNVSVGTVSNRLKELNGNSLSKQE